jgi:hypothetical protein
MFPQDLCHRLDDVLNIFLAHLGKKRQGKDAMRSALGMRAVPIPVAPLFLIIGLQVERRKMDAGPDITFLEEFQESVPTDG